MQKNAIIATATLLLMTIPAQATDISATVMRVTDGDTVQVRNQKGKMALVKSSRKYATPEK